MTAAAAVLGLNFPFKLMHIIDSEPDDIVCWSENGNLFSIEDLDRFQNESLPKYFQHTRFASFQRQLNLYGFRRISKGGSQGCYFHPSFRRGRQDLLAGVKRLPRKTSKNYAEMVQQRQDLMERQRTLVDRMLDGEQPNDAGAAAAAVKIRGPVLPGQSAAAPAFRPQGPLAAVGPRARDPTGPASGFVGADAPTYFMSLPHASLPPPAAALPLGVAMPAPAAAMPPAVAPPMQGAPPGGPPVSGNVPQRMVVTMGAGRPGPPALRSLQQQAAASLPAPAASFFGSSPRVVSSISKAGNPVVLGDPALAGNPAREHAALLQQQQQNAQQQQQHLLGAAAAESQMEQVRQQQQRPRRAASRKKVQGQTSATPGPLPEAMSEVKHLPLTQGNLQTLLESKPQRQVGVGSAAQGATAGAGDSRSAPKPFVPAGAVPVGYAEIMDPGQDGAATSASQDILDEDEVRQMQKDTASTQYSDDFEGAVYPDFALHQACSGRSASGRSASARSERSSVKFIREVLTPRRNDGAVSAGSGISLDLSEFGDDEDEDDIYDDVEADDSGDADMDVDEEGRDAETGAFNPTIAAGLGLQRGSNGIENVP